MRELSVVYMCLGRTQGYGWSVSNSDGSLAHFGSRIDEQIQKLGFNDLTKLWELLSEAVGGASKLTLTVSSFHDAPQSL